MHRWTRWIKHRWLDARDTRRRLPAAAVARLERRIAQSEGQHHGEIRICVEAGLPPSYLWKGLKARDRALTLFGKLRIWDTEANNGVLIYLLLADHAIEIVADRGLNAHVGPEQWQAVVGRLRDALQTGNYELGLTEAVEAVHAMLQQHFPLPPGASRPNELPDAIVLI